MTKEAKWMRQLCAGEPTAWSRLVDDWSPSLYSYITANGISEPEAQQIVHAIFSESVRRVVGSVGIGNLTVLLFSIAYRQMINYYQQSITSALPPPSLAAPSKTASDYKANHLLDTLRQFSPEIQQLLLLYYLMDVSLADIAQIVGQPEHLLQETLDRVKPCFQ